MKLYSDRPYQIAPAPVMQSVPRTDAQEIEANVELLTQPVDAIGQYKIPKRYTIIQHPSEQRVIACIVFTKKG
jgi:hypothetical protein